MIDIKNVEQELKRAFGKFNFEEEPHIYWWLNKDGERIQAKVSMTQLIHSYSQPFDAQKIAPFSAKKLGMTTKEVLAMWEHENRVAQIKGTYMHSFMEYRWRRWATFIYPSNDVIEQFGYDALESLWKKLTKLGDMFYNKYKDRLIPIGLELIVGDEELGICGSIDFLCYSKKLQALIIIDYKTNKEIKFKGYKNQKMRGFLSHLQDCNYIHYSLQLNGYQYIVERNTNLKLNNTHYLIWLNEKNDDFEIFTTKDLYKEAIEMIQKGEYEE